MSVCAVIPAAGRGSRLGLNVPKLLAPVTARATIWSLLYARLEGLVDHVHVVVAPADRETLQSALGAGSGSAPVSLGVQPAPIGMGDAIFRGYPVWSRFDTLLVIWGDQVHVSRGTLETALELHRRNAGRRVVIPLVRQREPYVEYRFDRAGRLEAIRQSREGDRCEPGGLGDVGTFVLSSGGLDELWAEFVAAAPRGTATGELNFLPFLVFLARRDWETLRFEVGDPVEARGVNTLEDLEYFRAIYGGTDLR